MAKIKYMGKLKNSDGLIKNSILPNGAVKFEEGNDIEDLQILGIKLVIPIMLVIIILTVIKFLSMSSHFALNGYTVLIIILGIIIQKILIFVHEFIHAIFYPKGSIVTIWKYKKAYVTYSNSKVSKKRFIIICLMPLIILGIIPFIIWLFIAEYLNPIINIIYIIITWYMIFGSQGDLANVYNTIKQVPKNADIIGYGYHSYYLEK